MQQKITGLKASQQQRNLKQQKHGGKAMPRQKDTAQSVILGDIGKY